MDSVIHYIMLVLSIFFAFFILLGLFLSDSIFKSIILLTQLLIYGYAIATSYYFIKLNKKKERVVK